MNIDVLVIAGTKDARNIIERLSSKGFSVAATVATEFGAELLDYPIRVFKGRLDEDELINLFMDNRPKVVLDASHPYAYLISQNAMNACKFTNIPYFRYERRKSSLEEFEGLRLFETESFIDAAEIANKMKGCILLTIGSNSLKAFTDRIDIKRIFARVLPDKHVLEKCFEAGLNPGNIIAMKGPFSYELNVALIHHCNAKILVTKDSGQPGGTFEKLKACMDTGTTAILVKRPKIEYINCFADMEKLINEVEKLVKSN